MAKRKYTEEMHQFIQEHYKEVPVKELTRLFNNHFNMDITNEAMRSYLTRRKMKNGRPYFKRYSEKYPKEIVDFIQKNHKGVGHQSMADMVNEKFGTSFSKEEMKGCYGRYHLNSGLTGRFEKGSVPPNKGKKMSSEVYAKAAPTMFKKGNVPINHRVVGSERVNVDGYIEIKIAEPNKWRLKHIVVWEEVNGPLPKGHAIIFLDSNRLNTDISNLKLVTRSELLVMNRYNIRGDNRETMEAAVNLAKLIDKTSKVKKKQEEK